MIERLKALRDPGTGEKFGKEVTRIINADGSFNVIKEGVRYSFKDAYQTMISMPFWKFFLIIFTGYFLMNALFAVIYCVIGIEHLSGTSGGGAQNDFWHALFFSTQTFTTVGYGAIAPTGFATSLVASVEALVGLLSFSVATGLLYGRFAKPSTRFRFSENVVISPYGDGGKALMFRVANERSNLVMNLDAKVMLAVLNENPDGSRTRKYYQLELETDRIIFFPLNWTIVHPLTESSPLSELSKEELEKLDAEILIQIQGYDETFAHDVHVRYSYTWKEFVWGAKFTPAYNVNEDGTVVMHLDKLNKFDKV